MPDRKVLIAGAGLGGLAAAASLLQSGVDVEVYEQARELAEVGAGIQMSANAMHVLIGLGLEVDIRRLGVRPGAYVFRLHDTGEVIEQVALGEHHERLHGAPYTQMHRADLHELLADCVRALKSDAIHLSRRVVGFDDNGAEVRLRLADGSEAVGDALIGADGVRSVVRAQLFGAAPATYTGDAAWRLVVPVERLPQPFLDPVMNVFMGPGGHVVCYYLRAGRLLNFVGLVETDEVSEESWTKRFPWDQLEACYRGWHPAVRAVIAAADRDQCFRWSLFSRPPIRTWSRGRVTLLGDAAHPTLPYLAQGAAMAIEDGAVLARALRMRSDVAEALDLYQRNRVDRTARIVEGSTANRRNFHLHTEAEIRRHFATRNEGADRNSWLYSYNPLLVDLA